MLSASPCRLYTCSRRELLPLFIVIKVSHILHKVLHLIKCVIKGSSITQHEIQSTREERVTDANSLHVIYNNHIME